MLTSASDDLHSFFADSSLFRDDVFGSLPSTRKNNNRSLLIVLVLDIPYYYRNPLFGIVPNNNNNAGVNHSTFFRFSKEVPLSIEQNAIIIIMALEIPRRGSSSLMLVFLGLLAVELVLVSAFQAKTSPARAFVHKSSTTSLSVGEDQISDFERPGTFLDEDDDAGINVVFIDEDDDMDDDDDEDERPKGKGRQRWENLKPSVKKRLIEKGQAKAIANKKKREPAAEKKRRESQLC